MEDNDRGDNTCTDKQISSITMAEPVQAFYGGGTPAFLKKLRKIVEDPETDSMISWSVTKESIMIWNKYEFCTNILPRFFKHTNYSSFIRQLNKYGFKKMNRDRDISEYAKGEFQGGKEHLLNSTMNRNKQGDNINRLNLEKSCLEAKLEQLMDYMNKINKKIMKNDRNPKLDVDTSYLQARIQKLKSYTNTMQVEIMELKQQQESIRSYLAAMKKRIEDNNEHKKEEIRIFLDKAFANRAFFEKFTQLIRKKGELGSGQLAKKQRLEDPQSSNNLETSNQVENGENQNEEVTAIETKEKKPVSDLVNHEAGPSKEQKAEEAVEWRNLVLFSTDSMLWKTILEDELNYENQVQAEAELAKYWQEKVVSVERKL